MSRPTAVPHPRRSARLVVAALTASILLAALDTLVFSTALPTIVGQLHGVEHLAWVTTAYLLASTVVMPVYGKAGDLIGRKWLFVAALSLFFVGSVLGGLSQSMPALITARAIQGLGGGGLMVLVQAIIADVLPPRERGRAMAVTGSMFAVSSVAGPLLGGWFTNGIGWRWVFWINLPVAALAIVAAVLLLHPVPRPGRQSFDVGGVLVLTTGVTALVLVTGSPPATWAKPMNVVLLATVGIGAGVFVLVERRVREPILPLRLLLHREFVVATVGGLCFSLAMAGVVGYLPTYLQMASGLTATSAGLLMIPITAGIMTSSFGCGALISRTGRYAWMPVAGAGLVAAAVLTLASTPVDAPLWLIGVAMFVMGLGMGLGGQALTLTVQYAFPREVGTATAGLAFFKEIGASLGASVIGGVFAARLATGLAAPPALGIDPQSLTPQAVAAASAAIRARVAADYHDALIPVYIGLVPMMVVAGALLLLVREQRLPETPAPTVDAGDEPALTDEEAVTR